MNEVYARNRRQAARAVDRRGRTAALGALVEIEAVALA
jgi:hypothetical protein